MTAYSEQELVKTIMSVPYAQQILKKVEQQLEEEHKKRLAFYDEITEQEKAEFINGEIIVHSPVIKAHNEVAKMLLKLLDTFIVKHQLGFVGYEKIMISLTRNDYEPDLCFFKNEKAQHFKPDQSLFPAPDLVVEVLSESTKGKDRGVKYDDYQAHGVEEYWLIHPTKKYVEQYMLNEYGVYELKLKATEGNIECKAVKDFNIPIKALFDETTNMEVLQQIVQTV